MEFLHHRDAMLKDAGGTILIPLLIFDQFEELFTLAQSDEFGRARAARFVEELADLVENRPPQALEAKFESDEGAAERFDFSRSDYRVVISLREDYLASLESLKKNMPSLSQNRLRLAPMTGSQALQAVLQPGRQLVSEEVAAAIVRFVAGGSEVANAEVEPSLLSLICRELNEQRIAQHRSEISLDLLAGSHANILSSFYERSLADQPPSVRRVIEDELLTESGYRENLAEERVLRRFQAAGASPEALSVLVDRRLLRIEERLDVRRVELTHDVLSSVVKASRDRRQEREAREATEHTLAQQRERELNARLALRRARMITAACTVLTVFAFGAAVLAFVNVQRARHAEANAQQTRTLSEQGRNQAQRLLGFLTDDFVGELETFGRYQTIVDLSQREIDYFRDLPSNLKDSQAVRNGALALVNHAAARNFLGDSNTTAKDASEAIALLEQLHLDGDRSDLTTVVLSRAYALRGAISTNGRIDSDRAVELLRPIAERAKASRETRRAYLAALSLLANEEAGSAQSNEAVGTARLAQELARQMLTLRPDDSGLKKDYAQAATPLIQGLMNLGRTQEARDAGTDAISVADQVLALRPQYGAVLLANEVNQGMLAALAYNELDPSESLRLATQQLQTSLALSKLEPTNSSYVGTLDSAYVNVANALWSAGRLHDAISYASKAEQALIQGLKINAALLDQLSDSTADLAYWQALMDDSAGASATLAAMDAATAKLMAGLSAGSITRVGNEAFRTYPVVVLAMERDDFSTAGGLAHTARVQLQTLKDPQYTAGRNVILYNFAQIEGQADFMLGDFAAAEQSERTALMAYRSSQNQAPRDVAQINTWLAMALAREGKKDAARQIIRPVVAIYRALDAKNRGDQWLPLEFAGALYAQSLTNERDSAALLREAAARVDRLVPAIASLHHAREWRVRIRERQAHLAGLGARDN